MAASLPGDRTRFQQVEALFHRARARPAGERAAFLAAECPDNDGVRREVAALLEVHDRDAARLEGHALNVAARLVADDERQRGPNPRPWVPASPSRRRVPLWLYALAFIFLADCLLRAYCSAFGPAAAGYTLRYQAGRTVIATVRPGSAADQAGLKAGDEILAIDGFAVRDAAGRDMVTRTREVGRPSRYDVRRGTEQLHVDVITRRMRVLESPASRVHAIWHLAALCMCVVALFIAFARPFDPLARLGALAMATISASLYSLNLPPGYVPIWRDLPWPVGALLWVPNLAVFLFGPIGLTFFARFPRPLFRARWPWLVVWAPGLALLPICIESTFAMVYRPLSAESVALHARALAGHAALFPIYGLADLAALTANYLRLTDINERRRLRLLLAGGAAGVLPGLVRWVLGTWKPWPALGAALNAPVPEVFIAVVFLLFPIGFATAIVRHQLFDIRIIVRMGLRYAMARGLLVFLVPALAAGLLLDMLIHGDQSVTSLLTERGWAYAAVAVAAFVTHLRRVEWGEAIDRRFFRERYDANRLLTGVVEDVRGAHGFTRAAPGVVGRIEAALHPTFAAILVRTADSAVFQSLAAAPPGHPPMTWAADGPVMNDLRRLTSPSVTAHEAPMPEESIELLVPIALTADREEALLALGMRRSQEPYSREDRRLLEAIAAGLALHFEQEMLVSLATPARFFEECPECGTCSDPGTGSCGEDGASLTPTPLPRTLAGRYRLERRRGRGGMGTVYEARDTTLGRSVAVKVIREELVTSPSAMRRFSREARVAGAFSHPNVVTVHDFGIEAGSRAYLVMELLEGVTLREELRRAGALGPARVLDILRPVCDAVASAHARQLIHRDLKPENIFLCRIGGAGSESVKILDFGIAKILDDEGLAGLDGGTETGLGVLVGTPGYMPPEQVLGERPTIAWDVWALAVVAYELLTGAMPFPVDKREAWMRSLLSGAYVPIDARLPNRPPTWGEFFDRALALDRTARPKTALELFRLLDAALG